MSRERVRGGYRGLEVWQKSMDLVEEVYRSTRTLPDAERYGLISQMQRASVSVPANVSEGSGRNHTREFIQHVSIAYGSLLELETHIVIARRLTYLEGARSERLLAMTGEIGRMLNGLRRSLEQRQKTDP